MYKTVWILGYLLYRLVQDFFHQQYGCYSMTISSSISIDFPRARAISSVVLKTSLQGNSNNVDQQHSSQCERFRLIGKCWSKEPSMKTLTILSLWYIYLATFVFGTRGDFSLDTDSILIDRVGLPSTKSHPSYPLKEHCPFWGPKPPESPWSGLTWQGLHDENSVAKLEIKPYTALHVFDLRKKQRWTLHQSSKE